LLFWLLCVSGSKKREIKKAWARDDVTHHQCWWGLTNASAPMNTRRQLYYSVGAMKISHITPLSTVTNSQVKTDSLHNWGPSGHFVYATPQLFKGHTSTCKHCHVSVKPSLNACEANALVIPETPRVREAN